MRESARLKIVIAELAEACAEILEAIEIIGAEMPRVADRLEAAREKINRIRWPE